LYPHGTYIPYPLVGAGMYTALNTQTSGVY
jgi:hypothetical protein